MRFNPRDLILVRPHVVEIRSIRACKQVARLEKVHMRVDVAGQNKFLVAFDPFRSNRDTALLAAGNALNLVAVDHNNGVFDRFAIRRVNNRPASERNFLSEGATRQSRAD